MRIIRNIILGILVFLLVNLFIALTFNICLKGVIVNGVIKEVVKQQIVNKDVKEGNTISQNITDNEQVNEILESKEVQDLINKYIDIAMQGIIDGDNVDEISLEEDMINYIKENKQVLEEKLGIEITDEMIQKTEEDIKSQEFDELLKDTIKKANEEVPEKQKVMLKGYVFLTSIKLRNILIFAILLDILLIAIVQLSYYKWIKVVGDALITSGIGITVMSLIVKASTSKMLSIEILHTEILTKHGIIQFVVGLVIIIGYKLILKSIEKKKVNDNNEISEEFTEQF